MRIFSRGTAGHSRERLTRIRLLGSLKARRSQIPREQRRAPREPDIADVVNEPIGKWNAEKICRKSSRVAELLPVWNVHYASLR